MKMFLFFAEHEICSCSSLCPVLTSSYSRSAVDLLGVHGSVSHFLGRAWVCISFSVEVSLLNVKAYVILKISTNLLISHGSLPQHGRFTALGGLPFRESGLKLDTRIQ